MLADSEPRILYICIYIPVCELYQTLSKWYVKWTVLTQVICMCNAVTEFAYCLLHTSSGVVIKISYGLALSLWPSCLKSKH